MIRPQGPSMERQLELFERLCDLTPEQADAELRRACGGDRALADAVRALLAADRAPDSGLDGTPALPAGSWDSGPPPVLPRHIGAYEILGTLGEGGMGVVYEARQSAPRRTIALKLLRPGLLSGERLRRFEHEAQVLGRLSHPGIAQVHEAGTATLEEGGRAWSAPYIAMELVRGLPLDRHAREHALDVAARLRLIARLCDAVQHAHDQGIVHRDLKPANVLVTAEGHLKVLDFGVARIVSDERTLSERTATGEVLGTLPYMSPEQVTGDPGRLDARSDVYSIGVIAYELLSGQRPLDVRSGALAEAARRITHDEPTRLGSLDAHLAGDVETMIGKAIAKEPAQRYASAADLAADLRRFLADQPILARAPSRSYRMRKFVRRHRELVAGAALAFLVLLGGTITSTWLYLRSQDNLERARRAEGEWRTAASEAQENMDRAVVAEADWKAAALEARENLTRAVTAEGEAHAAAQRAETEARTAREVADFVVDIFRVPDPSGVAGSQITALELLDQGREDIATRLADQPLVRAELMNVMGRVYFNLAQYAQAEPLLIDTIATLRARPDHDPLELADALFSLGETYHFRGELDRIRPLYEEALAIRRAHLQPSDPLLARTIDILGRLFRDLSGREDLLRARELMEEAYAMRLEAGVDDMELSESLQSLGSLAFATGDLDKAEEYVQDALAIRRELPEATWRVPELLHTLATLRQQRGRWAEAEALGRECLELCLERFGEAHLFTSHAYRGLAHTLTKLDRFDEAAELLEHAAMALTEENGPARSSLMIELAFLCQDQGDLEGAEAAYLDALDEYRRRLGEHSSEVAIVSNDIATLRLDQDRPEEAEALLDGAIAYFRTEEPDHHVYAHCLRNMARALEKQQRYDEAIPYATEALERTRAFWGAGSTGDRVCQRILDDVTREAAAARAAAAVADE